jgi:hypothetical protein
MRPGLLFVKCKRRQRILTRICKENLKMQRERVVLPGGVGVGQGVEAKAVVVAKVAERVVAGAEVKVTRNLQILLTVVIHQMMSLLKSMWQRNQLMMNQLSMTNMAVPMNQMLSVLMVMPMLLLPLHWK